MHLKRCIENEYQNYHRIHWGNNELGVSLALCSKVYTGVVEYVGSQFLDHGAQIPRPAEATRHGVGQAGFGNQNGLNRSSGIGQQTVMHACKSELWARGLFSSTI